jgi:hypothetical protein
LIDILRRAGIQFNDNGIGRTMQSGKVTLGITFTGPVRDQEFIGRFTAAVQEALHAPIPAFHTEASMAHADLELFVGMKPIPLGDIPPSLP